MPDQIEIGRLASAEGIPALVDIDRLVTRHSAVVGATGAGKSTLVARRIRAMSEGERWPSSRIIVLDTHGEYAETFGDDATVLRISSETEGSNAELSIRGTGR